MQLNEIRTGFTPLPRGLLQAQKKQKRGREDSGCSLGTPLILGGYDIHRGHPPK